MFDFISHIEEVALFCSITYSACQDSQKAKDVNVSKFKLPEPAGIRGGALYVLQNLKIPICEVLYTMIISCLFALIRHSNQHIFSS